MRTTVSTTSVDESSTESPTAQVFRYERPSLEGRSKAGCPLGRTDISRVEIQVVSEGGDNSLHYHQHVDGFRFILAGRARFYTTNDELFADIGPMEGIVIPRGIPYWFESASDTPLEMFHLEAYDRPLTKDQVRGDRVDLAPRKPSELYKG
ncbi:MAG: cupin protein [Acidimicrobiaceae bacterium]|nr:cupin protein [Acidimicrobiaceae bacterium]